VWGDLARSPVGIDLKFYWKMLKMTGTLPGGGKSIEDLNSIQYRWLQYCTINDEIEETIKHEQLMISPLYAMGPGKAVESLTKIRSDRINTLNDQNTSLEDITWGDVQERDGELDYISTILEEKYGKKYSDTEISGYKTVDGTDMEEFMDLANERREFLNESLPKIAKLLSNKNYDTEMNAQERKIVYLIYSRFRTVESVEENLQEAKDMMETTVFESSDELDDVWRF
jgi:hypothetical protein